MVTEHECFWGHSARIAGPARPPTSGADAADLKAEPELGERGATYQIPAAFKPRRAPTTISDAAKARTMTVEWTPRIHAPAKRPGSLPPGQGLISYHRGEMAILDRERLERAWRECYAVVHEQFDRLRKLRRY